jgi:outer membrane scaffolding protein for murein synthesis (MipA/OmpV family)
MKTRINGVALATVFLLLPGWAAAAETEAAGATVVGEDAAPAPVRHYLLGAALSSSRTHVGQDGRSTGLQPVWGFWAGRYRLSGGGAAALWNVGRETVVDPGLSTTLLRDSDWSLGASLGWGGERKSDDDARLLGVPDLRATLRGKLSAGYAFAPRWTLGLGASQDLLDRGGGGQYSAALSYRQPLSPSAYWDASLGLSWGSTTYMQGRYGIPAGVAGRDAYLLQGGLEGAQLGWRILAGIDHNWVAFGGVSLSRLVGDAARSPLVGERQLWSANVGIAYRN